jgi:hypothetical protein
VDLLQLFLGLPLPLFPWGFHWSATFDGDHHTTCG